ncbi:hypothetical protein XNC3_1660003 [Xenorhabdus nematophila F1]|nr:hypothetical protein XNC3_1660003 [Xenorhabdus nematophila F1]CEE93465.1 hypothetical protein XNA1_3810003 [Xenorhabdus nematophila str. Anatoliense]CEF32215.1 hypothetical protein XNW1_4270006 [Xenorhabdus nematophila str. Websteri]CEK24211.1 protein of unknown function [Xenorhabdus nematophila AN6/1]
MLILWLSIKLTGGSCSDKIALIPILDDGILNTCQQKLLMGKRLRRQSEAKLQKKSDNVLRQENALLVLPLF